MTIVKHGIWTVACCVVTLVQFGCARDDVIRRYRVAKQAPSGESRSGDTVKATVPDRLFGALIPQGERTWFLKVIGRAEILDKEIEKYRSFVESVRFSEGDGARPTWELPGGWQELPGSGMRYATLKFGPSDDPCELTVTSLPTPAGSATEYVLANINRWRQQMALPPIRMEQLPAHVELISLGGSTATVVSFLGHRRDDGTMGPPHAGSRTSAPAQEKPPGERISPLTYARPEGWTEVRVSGMRKAAFRVTDKKEQAEITVIDLAVSAGDLLPNVNRWRQQIQLEEITEEQLAAERKEIEVGHTKGDYIELTGPENAEPRQSIVAVIVVDSGRAWFFKLQGSVQLVEREKERFESFVQSVEFRPEEEADNGK